MPASSLRIPDLPSTWPDGWSSSCAFTAIGYCQWIWGWRVAVDSSRRNLLRVDLTDTEATAAAVRQADPELVTHLGAKSHMDRSIVGPASLIYCNVSGTLQLLQGVLVAGEQLACECQIGLLLGNISTNEVYCCLGETGCFRKPRPTIRAALIGPTSPPATTS